MDYINEQFNTKKKYDKEKFKFSMNLIAHTAMDRKYIKEHDNKKIAKSAIEEILNYFNINYDFFDIKYVLNDINEYIDYINKKYDVMNRTVLLKKGFYKDAIGPMITKIKGTDDIIVLIPNKLIGYTYYDYKKGYIRKVDKKNEKYIDENAIVFYKPLKNEKLGIMEIFKQLWLSFNLTDIFFLIFTSTMLLFFQLSLPALTFTMVEIGTVNSSYKFYFGIVITLVFFVINWFFVAIGKELIYSKIIIRQSLMVESSMFSRLLFLPIDFFKKYSYGELADKVTCLSEFVEILVELVWTYGFSLIFTLLFFLFYGFIYPSTIFPMFVIYFIATLVFIFSFYKLADANEKTYYLNSKCNGLLYNIISGIQKIKLTGTEKRFFSMWAEKYSAVIDYKYNVSLFSKIYPAIYLLVYLSGILFFYLYAYNSKMSIANFYALLMVYNITTGIFVDAFAKLPKLVMVCPIIDMIKPILETIPETTSENIIVKKFKGEIELVNVSFRYSSETPYIIKDLSLKINIGEYIGIVGKTGCGKTTLIKLLLGFEKAKGGIYFDKMSIDKIDPKSLRYNIGTVLQNDKLFIGSIYENISIVNPKLTIKEIYEYLKIANIYDDVMNMPMGIFTMISEGGGGLSGGQKQRILIARALATNPKILIFDEATSALDNITQMKISNALDNLGCTRIIIAHRLSTVKNCDRILVFDGGNIVEEGTYDNLIKQNGMFSELVKRQRIDI